VPLPPGVSGEDVAGIVGVSRLAQGPALTEHGVPDGHMFVLDAAYAPHLLSGSLPKPDPNEGPKSPTSGDAPQQPHPTAAAG
jgi:hypothetical protein